MTPVPIIEEEELGETYALASDAVIPNPLQGDHEAINTLENIFSNQVGTQLQKDIPKNDLGDDEHEEETQQPEIDSSTTDPQDKDDPFPISPVSKKTPPTDEDQ
jgi:hypothetical protein